MLSDIVSYNSDTKQEWFRIELKILKDPCECFEWVPQKTWAHIKLRFGISIRQEMLLFYLCLCGNFTQFVEFWNGFWLIHFPILHQLGFSNIDIEFPF